MLPDGTPLILTSGVLADPSHQSNQVVLWVPADLNGPHRCWDRVSTITRSPFEAGPGFRWVAARAIRAQRRLRSTLGRLFAGAFPAVSGRTWTLPDGSAVEACGERRADLVLAWAADATFDEARIMSHWPRARDCRLLGPSLYLVSGIEPTPPPVGPPSPDDTPLRLAERALAAARRSDDLHRLATALNDIGLALLLAGDAHQAAASLHEALAISRRLVDPAREADARINLAQAALALGEPRHALDLLPQALDLARSSGERHAEKAALDRLAQAHAALGEHDLGLACIEQALTIAAATGDRPHEANLHWAAAIAHAELDRRDRAIAHAHAAVDFLRRLGNPKADWYAHHLANYRSTPLDVPGALSYLGGSVDTSSVTTPSSPDREATGPGLLRMALTATKSMARFVGSGFRTATPQSYESRLRACATCEHHTGVRCRVCGCFTAAKARLEHERCPIGLWST